MRGILLCAVLVGMCPVSASASELRKSHVAVIDDGVGTADASANLHFSGQSMQSRQSSVFREIIEIRASGAG